MTTSTIEPPDVRRGALVNLAVNVVAPLALYYGLRTAGADQWLALTLGVIPSGLRAVWTVITKRRVDPLVLATLSILALAVAVSFVTGSPRFLLAKDGGITGIVGIWMLATLLRTPFYFQMARTVSTGASRDNIEISWRRSPTFRRNMQVATVIWGVGLVLDAVLLMVLAYTLPIDKVPLINGLQYVAMFLILEIGSLRYVRRSSTRSKVAAEAGLELAK
jgi:hypothetical protein